MAVFPNRRAAEYPTSLLPGTWWQMDTGTRLQIVGEPYRAMSDSGRRRIQVVVICGGCGAEFVRRLSNLIRCRSRCVGCDGLPIEEAA